MFVLASSVQLVSTKGCIQRPCSAFKRLFIFKRQLLCQTLTVKTTYSMEFVGLVLPVNISRWVGLHIEPHPNASCTIHMICRGSQVLQRVYTKKLLRQGTSSCIDSRVHTVFLIFGALDAVDVAIGATIMVPGSLNTVTPFLC